MASELEFKLHSTESIEASLPGRLSSSEVRSQVELIARSPQFKKAAVLQSFLRFVTEEALLGRAAQITEYTIATAVFARGASFDSSIDTIVRTQAYRLRMRLREYYSEVGQADAILVDIPKGHYVPIFSRRDSDGEEKRSFALAASESALLNLPPPPKVVISPDLRPSSALRQAGGSRRILWAITLAALAFAAGTFTGPRPWQRLFHVNNDEGLQTINAFWSSFCATDQQPIVAYGNSLYLADQTGDLLRWRNGPVFDRGAQVNPATAKEGLERPSLLSKNENVFFNDDLAGIGEVASAAVLMQSLARIGVAPTFKRSRQISTYDLSSHNTIFIGSPFVHLILNDLPKPQNFVFAAPRGPVLLWNASIVNTHPRPGEASSYAIERTPGSQTIHTDYALINVRTGLQPHRKIVILAGLSTSGTQAATQFLNSADGMRELIRRSGGRGNRLPDNLEAILRVRLNHGLDIIETECVAVR